MPTLSPGRPTAPLRSPPRHGSDSRLRPRQRRVVGRATFLREFIKAPGVVAAVAPSSRRLGREMIRGLDLARARTVVEFGPGLGTFTRVVLDRLPPGWTAPDQTGAVGRFIAIEYNRRLAVLLRAQTRGVIVEHDTAANVGAICQKHGAPPGTVDCVISGLGWPSFPDHLRTDILEATAAVLRPGGEFRTFGYHCGLLMRGAWHFRAEVRRLFSHVQVSKVIWGNMPPAFVYRCVR